jgi:ADP-ribose pyrophosphatase YjhB (NUDIX family)
MMPRPGKPQVRLGAGVLIVSPEGRLLIVQQERDGVADWGPPGGSLEQGEDIEACAVREALEETGLRVRLLRLLSVDQFWHAGRFEGVGFVFLAEPDPWPQTVRIPAFDGATHFLDHRWITRDEYRDYAPAETWEFWTRTWPADLHETQVRRLEFPR